MATAYGIDLGTTYSAIAKIGQTGTPEIISDTILGQDTLASAVFIDEDSSAMVGDTAKEEGVTRPERLHQFFKRWIGRMDDPNHDQYITDGKEYDPIELSSIVLGRIINYAKENGEDVKDVVITCPAYFNYAQREATKQAGEVAGLNVLAIINEPTAAAISYCYNRFNENQTVLVYDLGGGTFDVTLIRMYEEDGARKVDVLGTDGDAFLGGCDWDERLFQLLLSKYSLNYATPKEEIPDELRYEIRGKVEKLKMTLSVRPSAITRIAYEGENIQLEVTAEEFENETTDLVQKTVNWIDSVLKKAGLTDDDVNMLLMVGGSTKMPMIRNMLQARFGAKAMFNDPDKAVAKGAALIADMNKEEANRQLLEQMKQVIAKGGATFEVVSDDKKGEKVVVTGENGEKMEIKLEEIVPADPSQASIETGKADIPQDLGSLLTSIESVIDSIDEAPKSITVTDIAPRTFGIIVASILPGGSFIPVVDQIVKKDEKVPVSYDREYYTREANADAISLPVIESISENDQDELEFSANGEIVYPHKSELEMVERDKLLLPLPGNLPQGSPIIVHFTLDNLGNVKLSATEPSSGVTKNLEFNFNSTKQEDLEKMKEAQQNRLYTF